MAANIFEYKIKLTGDSDDIESKISEIGSKLLHLTKDEYKIYLDYDGNIKDLNKKINELGKLKGLNIPVGFRYDLNQKALEIEKEKLEKLTDFSKIINFGNIKSEIKKAFGTIDLEKGEIINKKNSLLSKLPEKSIGKTVDNIFSKNKNSIEFQNQITKIMGLLKYAKDYKIDLFDEEGIKVEAERITRIINDLLKDAFNGETAKKIFTNSLKGSLNVNIFDNEAIEKTKTNISLLQGILSNIEKQMLDIESTTRETKLDFGTSELDESLKKFADKIYELTNILKQIPQEIKDGIIEPLDNALDPETINAWKNCFLNALQEIKNDDFFKLWQINGTNSPIGDSALSKLSAILDKYNEADKIQRKQDSKSVRERTLAIDKEESIYGEYTVGEHGSTNMLNHIIEEIKNLNNEVELILHTHPEGNNQHSGSDIFNVFKRMLSNKAITSSVVATNNYGFEYIDFKSLYNDFKDIIDKLSLEDFSKLKEDRSPYDFIKELLKTNTYKNQKNSIFSTLFKNANLYSDDELNQFGASNLKKVNSIFVKEFEKEIKQSNGNLGDVSTVLNDVLEKTLENILSQVDDSKIGEELIDGIRETLEYLKETYSFPNELLSSMFGSNAGNQVVGEIDTRLSGNILKKIFSKAGATGFDFMNYVKRYGSKEEFINDNPMGLSKDSTKDFQELIEIKEVLIEVKQLLQEIINNGINDNRFINGESNSTGLNFTVDKADIQALFDKIQYLSDMNPIKVSVTPYVIPNEFIHEIENQIGTDKVYVETSSLPNIGFDSSKEINSLSELYDELKSICNKIEEKTMLFEDEEKVVKSISDKEKKELKEISKAIKDIVENFTSLTQLLSENQIKLDVKFSKTVATNIQSFVDSIKELSNVLDTLNSLKNFNIKKDASDKLKALSNSMSELVKSLENAPTDFIKNLVDLANSPGLKDLTKLSKSSKIKEAVIESKTENVENKNEKTEQEITEQQTKSAIREYLSLQEEMKKYYLLKSKLQSESENFNEKEQAALTKLTIKYKDAQNQVGKFAGDINDELYSSIANSFKNSSGDLVRNGYINDLSKFLDGNKYSKEYINNIRKLIEEVRTLDLESNKLFDFNERFEEIKKQSKNFEIANPIVINHQMQKIEKTLYDSSAMSKDLKKQFKELGKEYQNALDSKAPVEAIRKLNERFEELNYQLHQTGYYGKNVFTKMSEKMRDMTAQFVARYFSLYDFVRYAREAIQAVQELDSALTELKIVSGGYSSEIDTIAKRSYELAQNLGSTTSTIVNSITEWRRLGKSINDSMILAEQSAKLATGGLMEVSTATEAITSSLQAFDVNIKDTEKIVDQFIYLGNNYAITSEELATSLERSSAALVAAGNTIEEAEALEIAGNTILQDSDAVANAIKVLSMRLRGTKASELEKAGEDTEGLIENASKLYNTVQKLTKTQSNPEGVSIINKMNGEYKSTYQILKEISEVWDELSDVNRAALLETIAGKVRASAAAAILQNGDILESAYNDALYSTEGAGAKALETSLDSIEKKITILQNELKHLFQDIISSDLIKGLVDLITEFIKLVDKVGAPGFLTAITGIIATINKSKINDFARGFKDLGKTLESFRKAKLDINKISKQTFGDIKGDTLDMSAIQRFYDNSEEYNEIIENTDENTKSFLKNCKDGTISLESFTAKSKLANIALQTLTTVGIMAVTFALTEIIKAIWEYNDLMIETGKNAVNSFKEQQDKVNEYKDEVKSLYDVLNDTNSSTEDINKAKLELINIQNNLINTYGSEAQELDLVNASYNEQKEVLEKIAELKKSSNLKEDFYASGMREDKWYDNVLGAIGYIGNISKPEEAFEYMKYDRKILGGNRNSIDYARDKINNFSAKYHGDFDKEFTDFVNRSFDNIRINGNEFKVSGETYKALGELKTLTELFDDPQFKFSETDKNRIRQFISDLNTNINNFGEQSETSYYWDVIDSEVASRLKDNLQNAFNDFAKSEDYKDELYDAFSDLDLSDLSDELKDYIERSIFGSNRSIRGQYNLESELANALAGNDIADEFIKRIVDEAKNKKYSRDQVSSKFINILPTISSMYGGLDENTILDIFEKYGIVDRNANINEIVSRLIGKNQGVDDIDKIEKEYFDFINSLDQKDLNLLNKMIGDLNPDILYSVDKLKEKLESLKNDELTPISNTLTSINEKVNKSVSSFNTLSEAYSKITNSNSSAEEVLNSIISLNTAASDLGEKIDWESIFEDGKLEAQELKKEISSIDLTNNVLDSLPEDIDSNFKNYLNDLLDSIQAEKEFTTELEKVNSEFDKLQSSYQTLSDIVDSFNSGKGLTLDQLQSLITAEGSYIEMLDVENGRLEINKKKYQEKVAEELNSFRAALDNAAAKEIEALAESKVASETARSTVELNSNTIALEKNTSEAIRNAINKGVSTTEINTVVKKYDKVWKTAVKTYGKSFGSFMGGAGGSDSDDKERYKELLDAEIKVLDAKLEVSYIDFKDYINKRKGLIDKYYNEGLISAKMYYAELDAMYKAQLAIYDRVIKAVTKTLDDKVKSYQKEQNAIDKQIESLRKANEERQDAIDLQKKLYELERARSQRSRLVYRNGQLQYLNDPQTVKNAQSELENAKLEEQVKALEKQKEAIQDLIDALNEYKEKWQEIADIWDNMKNAKLAEQVLGSDWMNNVLDLNMDMYENFKNAYVNLEKLIDENAVTLANEELKELLNESRGGGGGGGFGGDFEEDTKNTIIKVVDPKTGKVYKEFNGEKYIYDEQGRKIGETEEYKQAQRTVQLLAKASGHTDYDIQEQEFKDVEEYTEHINEINKDLDKTDSYLKEIFDNPQNYIDFGNIEDASFRNQFNNLYDQKQLQEQQKEQRRLEAEGRAKQKEESKTSKTTTSNKNTNLLGILGQGQKIIKDGLLIGLKTIFGKNNKNTGIAAPGAMAVGGISLAVKNMDKVKSIFNEINEEVGKPKEIKLVAEDNATPIIKEINNENIEDKDFAIDTDNESAIKEVKDVDDKKVKDKKFDIETDGSKAKSTVDDVDSKKIESKSFAISAIDKASGIIKNIVSALAGIVDKVVHINTVYDDVDYSGFTDSVSKMAEEAAKAGAEAAQKALEEAERNKKKNPIYKPGSRIEMTSATGTFSYGNAYAKGTNGTAGYKGTALVGELGQELRVRDGRFELIGKRGAEFTDIKPKDIIFNASQTKALLKYGHINTRGKSFADGTDITPLSISNPKQYEMLNVFVSKIHNNTDIMKNSILNIDSSIKQLTKQVDSVNMHYNPTDQTPIINVNNPVFQCTGVTGEEVLHQIENQFEGLFLNAYQKSTRR